MHNGLSMKVLYRHTALRHPIFLIGKRMEVDLIVTHASHITSLIAFDTEEFLCITVLCDGNVFGNYPANCKEVAGISGSLTLVIFSVLGSKRLPPRSNATQTPPISAWFIQYPAWNLSSSRNTRPRN